MNPKPVFGFLYCGGGGFAQPDAAAVPRWATASRGDAGTASAFWCAGDAWGILTMRSPPTGVRRPPRLEATSAGRFRWFRGDDSAFVVSRRRGQGAGAA